MRATSVDECSAAPLWLSKEEAKRQAARREKGRQKEWQKMQQELVDIGRGEAASAFGRGPSAVEVEWHAAA